MPLFKAGSEIDRRVQFIGRAADLALLSRLLDAGRGVALIGNAGVGKSRLAIEAAVRWQERSGGELCSLSLNGLAPEAASAELSRALQRSESKKTLLLLDGCETAPASTNAIVRDCVRDPGVLLVATSRQPIAVPGLEPVSVAPLPESEAVDTFYARVKAAGASIRPDPATTSAIRRLCARLGGLPAAIGLAAASLAFVERSKLAAEADAVASLVEQASNARDRNYATTAALVDYALRGLDESARDAFLRASLFSRDFAADDLNALRDPSAPAHGAATLQTLEERSLLLAGSSEGSYAMPAAVRAAAASLYARVDAPQRRHVEASFARRMAEIASGLRADAPNADVPLVMQRLAQRYGDFVSVLEWGLRDPASRLASVVSVVWALVAMWADGGRFEEGTHWCDRIEAACTVLEPSVRAQTYYSCIRVAHAACRYDRILRLAPQAITMFTIGSDRTGLARCYNALSIACLYTGSFAMAQAHADTALRLYETLGHQRGIASALTNLGNVALEGRRDPLAAREYYERAGAVLQRAGGYDPLMALVYGNLAETAYLLRDADGVERAARVALAHLTRMSDDSRRGWQLVHLARAQMLRGDARNAASYLRHALDVLYVRPHPDYSALCFETVASLGAQAAPESSAIVACAAQRFRKEKNVVPVGPALDDAAETRDALRANLGDAALERARERADALDVFDVFELCRSIVALVLDEASASGKSHAAENTAV